MLPATLDLAATLGWISCPRKSNLSSDSAAVDSRDDLGIDLLDHLHDTNQEFVPPEAIGCHWSKAGVDPEDHT